MEDKKNQPDATGAKPSLMSAPELGAGRSEKGDSQAAESRILFNLKKEPLVIKQARGKSSRTAFKAFSFIGIAAVAAVFGYRYLSGADVSSRLFEEPLPTASLSAALVKVAALVPTQLVPAITPVEPVAAPEAAQIVNQPSPPVATGAAPDQSAKQTSLTTALEEGVKPPVAIIEKALENKSQVEAPSRTHAKHEITKVAPSSKKKGKPAIAPAVDEDINLLAALIAHDNASTDTARAAAVKASAAQASEIKKKEKEKDK